MPRGPADRWSIWALAVIVVLGFPATAWVYFPLLLASGTLDPAGDAVFIPMMGSIFTAVVASPVVAILTYLGVRKWRGARPLLGWRTDKPLTAAAAGVAFGLPAILVVVGAAFSLAPAFGGAWYELVWLPWYLCAFAWLGLLRAAAGA